MDMNEKPLIDYSSDSGIGRGTLDIPFLLLTLLLLIIGVIMVFSASFVRAYYSSATDHNAMYYFRHQLTFALLGVAAMLIASRVPIIVYRKVSFTLLAVSAALLLLVLVSGGGKEANGSRRWFEFMGITFQPSEIAKIAIILFDAMMICRIKEKMGTFKYGVLPFAAVAVIFVGLLILEPHISASIIIILITATMMYVGGTRLGWFVLGAVVVGLGLYLAISVFDYSSDRVTAWLNPFEDTSDTGYQIVQSLYAIGSGGFSGLGLGNSRQKYLYLPEEHNDFIFSIVCEELGFVGATIILILFALLIIRGYWLALHCRDRYSFLVCNGITTLLAFQVILNVAVVMNLVPCTGISLPFFSYGGTALMIELGEMGIILSISRDIPEKKLIRSRKSRQNSGESSGIA